MKPTLLKPGMQVLMFDTFGAPQPMVFVRRDKAQCGHSAQSWFQCEAYRGLDGPKDIGLCYMGDGRVARYVFPLTEAAR
jgi:hypothetical protein